jgi:membrane dipeptidase
MNQLGMVVDLSHCGYQTTIDGIQVSERPVAVTHSFCRALRDHDRGKTDDQLRLLAERDGYLGILAVPHFLGNEAVAPLSLVLDHIDHAVKVMGVHRVGIGTDWGSASPDLPEPLRAGIRQAFANMGFRPEHGTALAARPGGAYFHEFKTYTDWPAITRGLVSRGYSDDEVRGILGQNWLRFLRRAGLP